MSQDERMQTAVAHSTCSTWHWLHKDLELATVQANYIQLLWMVSPGKQTGSWQPKSVVAMDIVVYWYMNTYYICIHTYIVIIPMYSYVMSLDEDASSDCSLDTLDMLNISTQKDRMSSRPRRWFMKASWRRFNTRFNPRWPMNVPVLSVLLMFCKNLERWIDLDTSGIWTC